MTLPDGSDWSSIRQAGSEKVHKRSLSETCFKSGSHGEGN